MPNRTLLKLLFPVSALISLSGCKKEFKPTFDYQLDWGVDRVGVTLRYQPRTDDSTVLHYGNSGFGGQTDIFGCVRNLTVNGARFKTDSLSRTVTLFHENRTPLLLHYEIVSRLPLSGLNCPMEMFRPNISENFIYCHGVNLFLRHDDADSLKTSFRVKWGVKPDFPVFCMYNPGGGTDPVSGNAADFYSTLIVGDRNLNIDTVEVRGVRNFVVTAPRNNASYNRKAIAEYFSEFYGGITCFWKEDSLPVYSLVIYPFEKIPFYVSGTGLDNGFCARYDARADTILTDGRIDLFSHEIGHNWIAADLDNQWFGEGFNELQTMYMVVATGLKPLSSFVDYFNNSLGKLHHSAIRNLPNDSIRVHFWELGDYSWIPYWRGAVYAFRLTGQIEHATGNIYAFKDLMLALKGSTREMTRGKFMSVARHFLDSALLENDFERYIMRAETMSLETEFLPSGCVLKHRTDGTPYIEISDSCAFAAHFVL